MIELKVGGATYAEIAAPEGISRQRIQQFLAVPKAARAEVVRRARGECEECGKPLGKRPNIHHLATNIGQWDDLRFILYLCAACHRGNHRIYEPKICAVCQKGLNQKSKTGYCRLHLPWTHGKVGSYQRHKCRCRECTDAATAYARPFHLRLKGRQPPVHGTTASYRNYACRCVACTAAATAQCKSYAARKLTERAKESGNRRA